MKVEEVKRRLIGNESDGVVRYAIIKGRAMVGTSLIADR